MPTTRAQKSAQATQMWTIGAHAMRPLKPLSRAVPPVTANDFLPPRTKPSRAYEKKPAAIDRSTRARPFKQASQNGARVKKLPPQIIWADPVLHPMEPDGPVVKDTEPFPTDCEELKYGMDDERIDHCVFHCAHRCCQKIVYKSEARIDRYGAGNRFDCSCTPESVEKEQSKSSQQVNKSNLRSGVQPLSPETKLNSREIKALETFDINADITIDLTTARRFLASLHDAQVFGTSAMADSYTFRMVSLRDDRRETIACEAERKVFNEIEAYFNRILQPLSSPTRNISPADMKRKIVGLLGIALIEWKNFDWGYQEGIGSMRMQDYQYCPLDPKEMIKQMDVVAMVWDKWDEIVNELIKMLVLADMRAKEAERKKTMQAKRNETLKAAKKKAHSGERVDLSAQVEHPPRTSATRQQPARAATKRKFETQKADEVPQSGMNKHQKKNVGTGTTGLTPRLHNLRMTTRANARR